MMRSHELEAEKLEAIDMKKEQIFVSDKMLAQKCQNLVLFYKYIGSLERGIGVRKLN